MKSFILTLFAAIMLVSCSPKEEAATVNVQDLNKEFINAWNNKNTSALEGMLADDVDFLQGEVHFKGKNEVAQKWVRETIGTISDLKTNVVSSGSDSKMAYEAGTFSVDVLSTGPDVPPGLGEGNFILLWKKNAEGQWKLSYAQLEDLPVMARQ